MQTDFKKSLESTQKIQFPSISQNILQIETWKTTSLIDEIVINPTDSNSESLIYESSKHKIFLEWRLTSLIKIFSTSKSLTQW